MNVILRFSFLLLFFCAIAFDVCAQDGANPLRAKPEGGNKLRPAPLRMQFPQGESIHRQAPRYDGKFARTPAARTNRFVAENAENIEPTGNTPARLVERSERPWPVVQTGVEEIASPSKERVKLRPAEDNVTLRPVRYGKGRLPPDTASKKSAETPAEKKEIPEATTPAPDDFFEAIATDEPAEAPLPQTTKRRRTEAKREVTTEESADERRLSEAKQEVTTEESAEEPIDPPAAEESRESLVFEPCTFAPASFRAVCPGQTTSGELTAAWGKTIREEKHDKLLIKTFSVATYRSVEASIQEDRVVAIVAIPETALSLEAVAKEFELDLHSAATLFDSKGQPEQKLFPERGVCLHLTGAAVDEIQFEADAAQYFLVRAQERLAKNYHGALRDIATAIRLAPDSGLAHGLQASALFETGYRDEALAACRKAITLEQNDPQLFLTQAAILADLGDFQAALTSTKRALDLTGKLPELRARGLNQLADHLAHGPARDYKAALAFRVQAIEAAEPATKSRDANVRSVALEAVVDANLGAAQDVAWGAWKDRQTAVMQWLKRGTDAASKALAAGDLPPGQRLKVNQKVLAAYAGLEGRVDPAPQAEQTVRTARQLIEGTEDPLRKQRYAWEAGVALYDAVQTLQARGETEQALKYGELAVEFAEAAISQRDLVGRERFVLGRLYFRVGSLHSVDYHKHLDAAPWFAKAAPLLLSEYPNVSGAEMASRGESLVSIGVSYWATERQEEAVDLTQHGARLMEEAVALKALDRGALKVPYDNLAKMHRKMGNAENADSFDSLARKKGGTLR